MNHPTILPFNTHSDHIVHSIFLNIYKPRVSLVYLRNISLSSSRSRAITFRAKYRLPQYSLRAFVKVTPEFTTTTPSMAQTEIDICTVISHAIDRQMSPHFVYNYNNKIISRNTIILPFLVDFGNHSYSNTFTILINQDLSGPSLFHSLSFKSSPLPKHIPNMRHSTTQIVLLLQIIHSLYTLALLGIKHLDLHYNNILIVQTFDSPNVSYQYDITSFDGSIVSFYLPNVGFIVKIIDFDGAVKFPRPSFSAPFKPSINNPLLRSFPFAKGITNSYQQDFYKFLKNPRSSFSFINGSFGFNGKYGFFAKKFQPFITSNKLFLQYMTSTLSHLGYTFSKPNSWNSFNHFGYLVNNHGKNIPIPFSILASPLWLLSSMPDFKLKPPGIIAYTYLSTTLVAMQHPNTHNNNNNNMNSNSNSNNSAIAANALLHLKYLAPF